MGREQGSAAILAIIVMMLLGSLGAGLLMLCRTDLQIAINQRDGMAAQYLAEAGVQYAIAKLKTDPSFISQTEMTNHVITSQLLDDLPNLGSYTVQVGPDFSSSSTRNRLVTAIGIVYQAQRKIVAHITLPMGTDDVNAFSVIWNYEGG